MLKMQASIFFRMLKEGRKIQTRDKALLISGVCDAVTVSLSAENYKTFKNKYIELAYPNSTKRKALPADKMETAMILGAALQSALPYMREVYGGRQ